MELQYTARNGWEVYADKAHQKNMDILANQYIDFLSACKTERETVDRVVSILKKAGYSEEFKRQFVFRTYRGKAVFIARRGKKSLASGIRLISAHTDTPRLDFKQHPLQEQDRKSVV